MLLGSRTPGCCHGDLPLLTSLWARFAVPFLFKLADMQDTKTQSDSTFTLNNLSFRVPGRTLLHPLSLTFPAGKVTGLIGHNGSGKSTLLKMLGRHQPPSEGDILLDDQPLASWSSKAFARKVAYLPQQLPQAEGMTVRELVAIGRYPWHGALGRFGVADREKVEEAIALVGLKPLAHRLVKRRTKNAKAFHDKCENDTVPS